MTHHTLSRASRDWPLTRSESWAWGLVLLLFVAGDMATTGLGLQLGAVETNPGGLWLIETFGLLGGMLIGKAIVVGTVAGFYRVCPDGYRDALPFSLAAIGAVVTTHNATVILEVL